MSCKKQIASLGLHTIHYHILLILNFCIWYLLMRVLLWQSLEMTYYRILKWFQVPTFEVTYECYLLVLKRKCVGTFFIRGLINYSSFLCVEQFPASSVWNADQTMKGDVETSLVCFEGISNFLIQFMQFQLPSSYMR